MKDIDTINVKINFTSDTKGFWEGFWGNRNGLGMFNINSDPDSQSRTLQKYQKILYSRKLPNKEIMKLEIGSDQYNYLTWNGFRFGSDTIFSNFRYEKYTVIWDIFNSDPNYQKEC